MKSSQDAVKVTKGSPSVYDDDKADSGSIIHRYFCGSFLVSGVARDAEVSTSQASVLPPSSRIPSPFLEFGKQSSPVLSRLWSDSACQIRQAWSS
jgi:hypothetical protein